MWFYCWKCSDGARFANLADADEYCKANGVDCRRENVLC